MYSIELSLKCKSYLKNVRFYFQTLLPQNTCTVQEDIIFYLNHCKILCSTSNHLQLHAFVRNHILEISFYSVQWFRCCVKFIHFLTRFWGTLKTDHNDFCYQVNHWFVAPTGQPHVMPTYICLIPMFLSSITIIVQAYTMLQGLNTFSFCMLSALYIDGFLQNRSDITR